MEKRGQTWGFDLMIASIIFLGGIFLFYTYSLNLTDQSDQTLETMLYEGEVIADTILTEGSPENWNSANVRKIGILTENKINQTKLERFYELSKDEYQRTKNLLNTEYNYYIFFPEPININETEVEGIGKEPVNPKNLIKITRITTYKNKPTTLSIDIWN